MWNSSAFNAIFTADAKTLKITSQSKSPFQLENSRCKLYQGKNNRFDFYYFIEDRDGTKTGRKHAFKVDKSLNVSAKNKGCQFQIVLNRNTQLIGTLLELSDCDQLINMFQNIHALTSTNNEWLDCSKENHVQNTPKLKETANRTPLSCIKSATSLTNKPIRVPFADKTPIKTKSSVTPSPSRLFERDSNLSSPGEDDFKITAIGGTKSSVGFYGSPKSKNKSYTKKFPTMQKKLSFPDHLPSRVKKQATSVVIDGEHKERTVVGFSNLGNTCYMNSILQCILNIPNFYQDLNNQQNINLVDHKSLYNSLCNLGIIKHSSNSLHNQKYALKRVKTAISESTERFSGYSEHDAHEFLCKCLDQLKEELSEKINVDDENDLIISNVCPIKQNFESQITHTVTCRECLETVCRTESFNDFSLVMPEVDENSNPSDQNLKELIKMFFADEIIEYKCDKCSAPSSTLSHQFKQLPRVLIFHIKRYDMNEEKKCDRVTLPKSLKIDFLISENTNEPLPFVYKKSDILVQPNIPSEKRKSVGVLDSEPLNKSFKFSDPSLDRITGELLAQDARERRRQEELSKESFTKLKSANDKENNFKIPKLSSSTPLVEKSESFVTKNNKSKIDDDFDFPDDDFFNNDQPFLSKLSDDEGDNEDDQLKQALELSMQEFQKSQCEDFTKVANEKVFKAENYQKTISDALSQNTTINGEKDIPNGHRQPEENIDIPNGPPQPEEHIDIPNGPPQPEENIYISNGPPQPEEDIPNGPNSLNNTYNGPNSLNSTYNGQDKSDTSTIKIDNLTVDNIISESSYKLVGVVNHHGSNTSTGHYTSDSYDFKSNGWRSYNDSSVSDISEHQVRFGSSQSAYIVFYLYNKCYTAISSV